MSRYRRDVEASHFGRLHRFKGAFNRLALHTIGIANDHGTFVFPRWAQSQRTGQWHGPIHDRKYKAKVVLIQKKVFFQICHGCKIPVRDMIDSLITLSLVVVSGNVIDPTVFVKDHVGRQVIMIDKRGLFDKRDRR